MALINQFNIFNAEVCVSKLFKYSCFNEYFALLNSSFEILLSLNNPLTSLFISSIDSFVFDEFTEPPPINKGGLVFHCMFEPKPYE